MPAVNLSEVAATAQSEAVAEATKEVVKKLKVIAKRQGQVDAFANRFKKKVDAFQADLTEAGDNTAAIMAALEAHKFPEGMLSKLFSNDSCSR